MSLDTAKHVSISHKRVIPRTTGRDPAQDMV